MLPALVKMFALVRDLSARREVAEIPASRWLVQRHNLASLAALAGVSQLRADLAASTVRWMSVSSQVRTVFARLAEAGIAAAPIKGFAYASTIYEAPAARPMTDVDLLVEPGRDAAAQRVLAHAGFRCRSDVRMHHASTWERDDLTLDLHRDIMPVGRGRVALPELWARTRPGWPEGARRLEPVDELVFHLAHMARNRLCGPLVQVVDAALLLEHASADAALARAREWRIVGAVAPALAYCRWILDRNDKPRLTPPEEDVLFARQPRVARKLVFDVATAGSVQQLAARVIGGGFQWLARRSKDKVAR